MSSIDCFFCFEPKDWISLWAGIVSTALAVIKIYETWRDRSRIDVSLFTTSSEVHGNELQIRNLSDKPIFIIHWELFAAHDAKGKRDCFSIESGDFDSRDISLAPHSSLHWSFSEANFFSTEDKFLKGRSIYLKLWIAGRRPWTQKIYPFDN